MVYYLTIDPLALLGVTRQVRTRGEMPRKPRSQSHPRPTRGRGGRRDKMKRSLQLQERYYRPYERYYRSHSSSGTTATTTAASTATPEMLSDIPAVPARYRLSTTAGKRIGDNYMSRHRYYRRVYRYYRHLTGSGTTAGPGGTTAACVQSTGIFPCIPSLPTPLSLYYI